MVYIYVRMTAAQLTLFMTAILLTPTVTSAQNEVIFSVKPTDKNIQNVTFSFELYKQFQECLCSRFINRQCFAHFTQDPPYNVSRTSGSGTAPTNTGALQTSNYICTINLMQHVLRCTRFLKPSEVNEMYIHTYNLENSTCGVKSINFMWINDGEKITFRNESLSPEICDSTQKAMASTVSTLPSQSPASDQTTLPTTSATSDRKRAINSATTIVTTDSSISPATETVDSRRDEYNGPPVNIILGVVLGVIIIAVIVIVGVVVWKRRKAVSKSSDHSSRNPTRTTSSETSHEQNSKKKRVGEPYYVNTRPSTHVSKPHVSSNGHRNSSSMKEPNVNTSTANSRVQQGINESNDTDFGYYTGHTVSSEKDDKDITNDSVSAEDNAGNQFNRTSDDYGYAHAEDPSNEGNKNITNKNGPPITVTVHSGVKNVNDDYDYAFCDDDEIPAGKKETTNSKNNNAVLSSSSKAAPSSIKVKDEYAVVNKNRSVATGDSINNGVSSQDDAGSWAGISSEAADVYSKLHENERHITDPYDSLLHLNSSSDAGNQSEPAHKLHLANQSSPYDLAQPIPGTSANENGSSATVEFELVPVSSSAGKSDEKYQALQGKKQAKTLPYGPEDYAVVIKNKPSNESKAAGFELDN